MKKTLRALTLIVLCSISGMALARSHGGNGGGHFGHGGGIEHGGLGQHYGHGGYDGYGAGYGWGPAVVVGTGLGWGYDEYPGYPIVEEVEEDIPVYEYED